MSHTYSSNDAERVVSEDAFRSTTTSLPSFDFVCLSHLRWNFVFQRPQHLMARAARDHRVFFVEEPLPGTGPAHMDVQEIEANIWVAVPRLPEGTFGKEAEEMQSRLLADLLQQFAVTRYVLWYYTPMALGFTEALAPAAVVYDCMDELSGFANASSRLQEREAALFARADLVFTGGQSLYEAKRDRHLHIFPFPSGVDVAHFARARDIQPDPPDQAAISHPRLGFYGVIDERMDYALLEGVAIARPDWQLVLLGPTAKIEVSALPRQANIHYLGMKTYAELPAYLAGWDVALLPFAQNAATRFISPTKTPEYLAAGKPVVSTPIRDVVRPYGEAGLVHIAGDIPAFVAAIAQALTEDSVERQARTDTLLASMSWDRTWAQMLDHIEGVLASRLIDTPETETAKAVISAD